LTQYYYPELGAPQIRLRHFVRELHNKGIPVEVLTAMPNYPAGRIFPGYQRRAWARELLDGVRVRRVALVPGSGRSTLLRLANYLSFTSTSLVAALAGRRPGLLFVESQPLSLGLVALALKRLFRVPYIYNVPDLQIDVARDLGFVSNRRFLELAQRLEDYLSRQAWMVSTVTPGFIEHFADRGVERRRISFLPNGADTEFLRPLPPSQPLLQRWGLQGKKVFLYVGTHAIYHGLDTLIEAADLLRDDSSIAFLFIGDGPERAPLKQLAAERGMRNVVFGESPYEEMDQLYSIAYASLAALRKMTVSSSMRLAKVMGSLSCGVPMIYAGEGESAELLAEHGCGVAVPPGEPALLAAAIRDLAGDPERREAMSKAGRALAEREYAWSSIVERWLGQVAELMRAEQAAEG